MYKITVVCLLYISVFDYSTESVPQKLFKRQTLIEKKENIGEGVESWAVVGDIPTPTSGRVRLSDEPGRYREQLQELGSRQEDKERLRSGERLIKRWIRDGDIDRERSGSRHGVYRDNNWNDRRYHSDEERRYTVRTPFIGRRTDEPTRYRRALIKLINDDGISDVSLNKDDDLSFELAAHSDNRRNQQYGGGYYPPRIGYDNYGRRTSERRLPSGREEESKEEIIIVRREQEEEGGVRY